MASSLLMGLTLVACFAHLHLLVSFMRMDQPCLHRTDSFINQVASFLPVMTLNETNEIVELGPLLHSYW